MAIHYVCARCGKPGIPDDTTMLDARYTTGQCTGDHIEKQTLIVEGFHPKERKKPKHKT